MRSTDVFGSVQSTNCPYTFVMNTHGPRGSPWWAIHVKRCEYIRSASYTITNLAGRGYLLCIMGENFSTNLLLPWLVPTSGVAGIADDGIPPC